MLLPWLLLGASAAVAQVEPILSPARKAALARQDELEGGASAGRLDGTGSPAMHSAKSLEAVQLLRKHGADIDAQDRRGFTALANAVERGEREKVKR
jgi:hypothetical protein